MSTPRVKFISGREPSANFHNRIQDPPTFDGVARRDYWAKDELRGDWGINNRDGIKDYEIDIRSSLAATAHFGLVYGATNDPLTGIRIERTNGLPSVYLTSSSATGTVNLDVKAGTIVNSVGDVLAWDDTVLTLPNNTLSFAWVNSSGVIQTGLSLPASTQIFTPLFKADVNNYTLVDFEDLRPNSHLAYQPNNYFVLLNTDIKSSNYGASVWERVLVDTSLSSLVITLPNNPTDGDKVAVLDVGSNASTNSVLVQVNTHTINNNSTNYVINNNLAHVVFVYSNTRSSWYVETDYKGTSINPNGEVNLNVPISYKKVNTDYTVSTVDYKLWIDMESIGTSKILTLPQFPPENTELYGFELYFQSVAGSSVIATVAEYGLDNYLFNENETAKLIWLDNRMYGGNGVWKVLRNS